MQRVAALFLPHWPIERLWRAEARTATPPEPRAAASLAPLRMAAAQEQEHACSAPRGGGWRPGARWAREDQLGKAALPPVTRQPARHEVGRREEAAKNPFRAMPPDEGGRAAFLPQLAGGGGPPKAVEGRRTKSAGYAACGVGSPPGRSSNVRGTFDPTRPSTIAAQWSPSPSELGEELNPLITSIRNGSRIEIAAACPQAQSLGLRPGMAVTQARAQVRGLDIRPADPEGDAAALHGLAVALARRWSPTVAVEGVDTLFLDLTGVAHLHGGEARMAARLTRLLARLGFTARIAIADTPGAAWALAHHATNDQARATLVPNLREKCEVKPLLCPPGRHGDALAPLPIEALRIDAKAVELLHRLGVTRIDQLVTMPRGPLVRRFGAGLALQLDRALGRLPEPLHPVIPPEPITVQQRFAEPIATAEAIEHWLGQLVPRLAAALEAEGLGVQALECVAARVDGVPQRIRIGLARPNRDSAHLLRLLKRRIEDIEPGYGVDAIALHVRRAAPLGPEPMVERLDEEAAPDIATLVDTLATRIGQAAMWRMRPVESDVPERSAARTEVLETPERIGARPKIDAVGQLDRSPALHPWHPGWPKPARLLARPEQLDHVLAELPDQPPRRFTWRGRAHRVICADGPERVHGEWWRHDTERANVRDYFRVEDESGHRYWLFRSGDGERPTTGDMRWYLHGVFG